MSFNKETDVEPEEYITYTTWRNPQKWEKDFRHRERKNTVFRRIKEPIICNGIDIRNPVERALRRPVMPVLRIDDTYLKYYRVA